MALILPIKRNQNVHHADFPMGYHRISEINISRESKMVRINVLSYPDEEARRFVPIVDNSKSEHVVMMPHHELDRCSPHIGSDSFNISLEKYDKHEGNEMCKAYSALKKEIAKFATSKDC